MRRGVRRDRYLSHLSRLRGLAMATVSKTEADQSMIEDLISLPVSPASKHGNERLFSLAPNAVGE
jgi:hypothetical protein